MYEDNQIKLVGNLGYDAETRFFERGQLTEMRMAIYAGKDKPATWVKVKSWGEINDTTRAGLIKGARVTISGYLSPCEAWVSKADGQAKATSVVTAEHIDLTPWKGKATPDDSMPIDDYAEAL